MKSVIDLSGQRFGRWLVLSQANATKWACVCSCGKCRDVSGASLRRGLSRSCGCLLRERAAETKINDLTGRQFGRLTVLSRANNSAHGDAMWKALCLCGAETIVRSCNLVSGNTASCGCARVDRATVRPADVRARANARKIERYRTDPKFNLRARMANAIRISLRRTSGGRKAGKWEMLVGYSCADLYVRLQQTLPAGATWQDYLAGRLEIDHIIPLDAFNYSQAGDLDFQRAWALTNLRLLHATENASKSNTLAEPFQPSLRF